MSGLRKMEKTNTNKTTNDDNDIDDLILEDNEKNSLSESSSDIDINDL